MIKILFLLIIITLIILFSFGVPTEDTVNNSLVISNVLVDNNTASENIWLDFTPSSILISEEKNQKTKEIINPNIDFDTKYLLGKLNYQNDSRFIEVSLEDSVKSGMYLRKETYLAFKQMTQDAKKDKIDLIIISGARNFETQKNIWENKWSGLIGDYYLIEDEYNKATSILEQSDMPGTSRHHWGTEIDLNNLNNSYFYGGEGLKIYNWLAENASKYGFCQPYSTQDSRSGGYQEERWHWSYLPTSSVFTQQYSSLVKNDDLSGFLGDHLVSELKIIVNYVLNINRECL